jgi:predicted dehydrogenase
MKDSAFWKNRPMEWRFEKEKAGTGVLGDLGVHLIDMTRLLVGDFDMLTGHTEIIVKERPWPDGSGIGQVGTDDFCTFIASMKNGATANFTISRCAIGEKNSIRFDVFGTKGVISFDLNNPDVMGICTIDDDPKLAKMNQVEVPKEYHVLQEQSFVDAILGNKVDYFPDIYEAIECQKILDAVQESSESKTWVKVH